MPELARARTAQEHDPEPIDGSAYRTGRGNATGTPADLRNSWRYPVTAVCQCSGVLYRASIDSSWVHTGRLAGQAPAGAIPGTPAAGGHP